MQQRASNTTLKSAREKYSKLALEAFERAVQQDPNDHLAEYYLALQHALNYNIIDALVHIRIALSLRAEHANSLHLFALLLTANRRPREALLVADDALEEFPDNLNLLHVKAHLELHLQDADTALVSVKRCYIFGVIYMTHKQMVRPMVAMNEILIRVAFFNYIQHKCRIKIQVSLDFCKSHKTKTEKNSQFYQNIYYIFLLKIRFSACCIIGCIAY